MINTLIIESYEKINVKEKIIIKKIFEYYHFTYPKMGA